MTERTNRKDRRLAPRDFRDFTVQLHHEDDMVLGNLGDISESGLCIVADDDKVSLPEPRAMVEGYVSSKRLKDSVAFEGRVAWTSIGEVEGKPCAMAGIQFYKPASLPDTLTALSISAGD